MCSSWPINFPQCERMRDWGGTTDAETTGGNHQNRVYGLHSVRILGGCTTHASDSAYATGRYGWGITQDVLVTGSGPDVK